MNNIDELILSGALEVYGVNPENGELLYNFTEKLEEVAPEVYNKVTNNITNVVMSLWEKEFLYMDISVENPDILLLDKAFDENEKAKLSNVELNILQTIIRSISEQQ